MTIGPDELVEIRDEATEQTYADKTIRALCDALEAAWAEREIEPDWGYWQNEARKERKRAERAESLLAVEQLHDTYDPEGTAGIVRRLRAAEAALARVRALCDTGRIFRLIEGDDYVTAEIRAALDQREGQPAEARYPCCPCCALEWSGCGEVDHDEQCPQCAALDQREGDQ